MNLQELKRWFHRQAPPVNETRRTDLKLLAAGAVAVPVAYVGVKHGAIASALGMKQGAAPVNSQYYPFPPLNADPQGAPPGAMWYNAPLGTHRFQNGVSGKIQNVQTPTLGSLEDVALFAPADGQYFGFDLPSSKWMNKTLPVVAPAALSKVNAPTSGTVSYGVVWPFAGTYIRITFNLAAYVNNTATNQLIAFPVPFTVISSVSQNQAKIGVAATLTGLTLIAPNSTTAYSGLIVVEGY